MLTWAFGSGQRRALGERRQMRPRRRTALGVGADEERLEFPPAALYRRAGAGGFGPEYTLFSLARTAAAEEDTMVEGSLDHV